MSSKRVKWTDEDKKQVAELLEAGSDATEVAAVLSCAEKALDTLCKDAFGLCFDDTQERFAAKGRAKLRRSLFQAANAGNAKALDLMSRAQLGMDPVKSRRRAAKAEVAAVAESLDL
ncbi:hypothetical protein [Atopobium fossor]|uniref:hypothetical protein n=1 Tax=Atopobium fossor TaxID=39487 RepID=UPI0012EBC019|nr:hypothetical protein [Atopobium fossor]